ncbi:MAG: hypothetical protein EOP43_07335, partial [Sphingobacteriaceae bacterium]
MRKFANLIRFCFLILCFAAATVQAQNANPIKVSYQKNINYFPLVQMHKAASLYIDTANAEVVNIAAAALQNDVKLVSGVNPLLIKNNTSLSAYPIIIGTIGQSTLIDQLIKNRKIQAEKVKGKWETFSIAVVN